MKAYFTSVDYDLFRSSLLPTKTVRRSRILLVAERKLPKTTVLLHSHLLILLSLHDNLLILLQSIQISLRRSKASSFALTIIVDHHHGEYLARRLLRLFIIQMLIIVT